MPRLRILGIGVFFVAFVLIFILIIGGLVPSKSRKAVCYSLPCSIVSFMPVGLGGYVPSWLKPVLKAIGF